MSTQIAKKQKIVLLQGDIQLWMDAERADLLSESIKNIPYDGTIEFDGRTFTRAIFRGIVLPEDVEEQTRRKNGQWKCGGGTWHDRYYTKCMCVEEEKRTVIKAREEAAKKCRKCDGGWVRNGNIVFECECTTQITIDNKPKN